jgi:diaminopimelate epimerase
MDFVKMHGLGNDFVMIEVASWDEADKLQPYAESICNRNFGIGADGLIAIGKDSDMDVFMRIFNSDGSEPEMCGNGIRCVAKYAFEHGLTKKHSLAVKTLAGPRYPEMQVQDGQVVSVRVDMGEPVLERARIPMQGEGSNIQVEVETKSASFRVTAVSMGNPHCITFVNSIDSVPVAQWGPELEKHPLFPAKTNVEFVEVVNRDELIMRVWERGAGITLACGTGACATLVSAVLNGYTERKATVHLLGGDLFIEWSETNQHVYMTGPATEVFKGQLSLGSNK